MPDLAQKICLLRTQAQMTQLTLAERLDVSRQTVSKWELGTAQPELEKLVALSELFHVSTDYLLKSRSAEEPEAGLDRMILRFLGYARDMEDISADLVGIMRDGVIDRSESVRVNEIIDELNAVSSIIEELKYCLIGHSGAD